MSLKEYFDEARSKVVNVLESLTFNGASVLTSTYTSGRNLPVKDVADPVDPQDAVNLQYLEQTNGGAAIRKVNLIEPTLGNVSVTLDSVAQENNASSVAIEVPAEVYGATWEASPEVPTKGDVYTKMETKVDKEEGKGLISTEDLEKLNAVAGLYWIKLPSASTVAGRVAGAVAGTDYPVTWSLAQGISPVDLVITHNLGKRVSTVTVFAITGDEEQQLFNTAAFNGVITPNTNTLRIQSLATITKAIKIYIQTI